MNPRTGYLDGPGHVTPELALKIANLAIRYVDTHREFIAMPMPRGDVARTQISTAMSDLFEACDEARPPHPDPYRARVAEIEKAKDRRS